MNLPEPQEVIARAAASEPQDERDERLAFLSETNAGLRYRYLKAEAAGSRQIDRRTQMYYMRGLQIEEWYLSCLEDAIGGDLERQHIVPSRWDTIDDGHVDAYHAGTRTGIEVKSVGDIDSDRLPYPDHLWQAAAYVNLDEIMEVIYLDYIEPSGFESRRFPITPSDSVRAVIEARNDKLHASIHNKTLPPRCETLDGAVATWRDREPCTVHYGRRVEECPFLVKCWPMPQPESEPPALSDDDRRNLRRLLEIEEALGDSRQDGEALRDERVTLLAQLEVLLISNGGEISAEGATVKRTVAKARKPSLDYEAAVTAGLIEPGQAQPFVKNYKPSTRWYVKADD